MATSSKIKAAPTQAVLAKTGYVSLHWAFFVFAGLSLFALGRQAPTYYSVLS